jgi:hypothetical protein
MQALLGHVSVSEARWLRHARTHLAGLFPYLPGQSGYNKRLRKLPATMIWLIRILATDTSWWHDDVWVIDSTPVECGPPAALSAGHRRSRRDCAHRPATASAVLAWCTVATCPAGASGAWPGRPGRASPASVPARARPAAAAMAGANPALNAAAEV